MSAPILTLAEVQALAGFTEGPWRMSIENGCGIAAGHRKAVVWAYSSPLGWPCVQVEQASKPLVLAAPALHATCLHLHAEVARLTAERERLQAPGLRADLDTVTLQRDAGRVACAELTREHDTLAAEVKRLRAHNARMVAQIGALADACEAAMSSEDGPLVVCDALPGRRWSECSTALRRLAAGEVDDG